MRKRSQIKKRPVSKPGLSKSLAPQSGKPGTKIEKLLKEYGTDKIHNGTDKRGRVIEKGKIVHCPVCGSSKIIREPLFDYIKTCKNNECRYYVNSPKNWRNNFNTGVHN
jgi:hypothetical protein